MALIDKETIRAEIERRCVCENTEICRNLNQGFNIEPCHKYALTIYQAILDFLDTLPDEPNHLEEALELVAEYNLQPYRDGNAWCILLGKDIQSGICGFGDTRLDAMLEFKKEYDSYVKRTHLYPAKEQSVEGLEEKIEKYFQGWFNDDEYGDAVTPDYIGVNVDKCKEIARHFYDLGCRHTAVMYDDIEYERQRAEESELSGDLEEEIKRMVYDVVYDLDGPAIIGTSEYLSVKDIADIARHFAEWGAKQEAKMPKWKHPEAKYQYPEALTRIMDEYGDWHYGISEGHLNPDCEYISLAELSLMAK